MPRKLVDLEIHAVAGVDRAANRRKWLLVKRSDDGVSKQDTKREEGEDFPAEAFAYVPDPEKPSEWKLRLWDSLKERETAAQVGRAVAALGPGFRGQRVDIPAEDLAGVISRVRAAWKRVHPEAEMADMPDVLTKGGFALNSDGWVRRALSRITKKLGIEEEVAKMAMTTSEVIAHDEAVTKFWDLKSAFSRALESILTAEDTTGQSELLMRSVSEFVEGVRGLLPHLQMDKQLYKAEQLMTDLQEAKQPTDALNLLKAFCAPKHDRKGDDTVSLQDILKGMPPEQRQIVEAEISKAHKPGISEEIQNEIDELKKSVVRLAGLEKRAEESDKRAEAAEKRAQEAEGIAKAERDARIAREYLEKGARYPVMGAAPAVADMLQKAYDTSAEFGQQLEATFQKAQSESDANNNLFKSLGHTGIQPVEGSAEDRLEKMARDLVAKRGGTYEQAYDDVLRENPALYTEMRREQKGGH